MRVNIENRVLELAESDITEMETDAIVNATNARLILGGGVAGVPVKFVGGFFRLLMVVATITCPTFYSPR